MNVLDNPVWNALSENHQPIALILDGARFYKPEYCPFGALDKSSDISSAITKYSEICPDFYLVGEKPIIPASVNFHNELVCLQYVIDHKIDYDITAEIVVLNGRFENELYDLVNLVQPGFFKNLTSSLGNYYGIFEMGKLVAATGERMQMNACTEVSAVVTHPGFTGKGLAKQLVTHTVNQIINLHKIAFLHVNEKNLPAVRLYERLGFKLRRKISFWHLRKNIV